MRMEQVNGLQVYMNSIRNVPLLTKEEERDLALKFAAGDKKAKEKL